MNSIDFVDFAMLLIIAACLFWLRSLRQQNAELRACIEAHRFGRSFVVVVERDSATNMLVGCVPGIEGAHSQGRTWAELREHMQEVLDLLDREGRLQAGGREVVGHFMVTLGGERR